MSNLTSMDKRDKKSQGALNRRSEAQRSLELRKEAKELDMSLTDYLELVAGSKSS